MTRKRGTSTAPPVQAYTPVTDTPEWMKKPSPCTPEQNERAHQLVWAIYAEEITPEQAHRVLDEIFQPRRRRA